MTKEEAINVLIQAAQLAQTKGAFDLGSAKLVATAVETLAPTPSTPVPTAPATEDVPVVEVPEA